MPGRKGVNAARYHILQQVLVIALVFSLHKSGELPVHYVLVRVRKIPFKVHFYYPRITSKTFRNLVYVGDNLIYSFVAAIANPIVVSSVRQLFFQQRPETHVDIMVHHPERHFTGEDLARSGPRCNKSIGGRRKGMVRELAHQPRYVPLPVQFELDGVSAPPLVLPGNIVGAYEVARFYHYFVKSIHAGHGQVNVAETVVACTSSVTVLPSVVRVVPTTAPSIAATLSATVLLIAVNDGGRPFNSISPLRS